MGPPGGPPFADPRARGVANSRTPRSGSEHRAFSSICTSDIFSKRRKGRELQTPPMPPTLYPLSRSLRTIRSLHWVSERLSSSSHRPHPFCDHVGRRRNGLSFVDVSIPHTQAIVPVVTFRLCESGWAAVPNASPDVAHHLDGRFHVPLFQCLPRQRRKTPLAPTFFSGDIGQSHGRIRA